MQWAVAGVAWVRAVAWPASIYGMPNVEWWRFFEHAFWVVFCIAFLMVACRRQVRPWRAFAEEGGLIEALAESDWRERAAALPARGQ